MRPAVGPRTAVLPLLNGLVHLDRLAAAFGGDSDPRRRRLCRRQPAAGRQHPPPQPALGHRLRRSAGGVSERVRAIAAEFADSKVDAPGSDNVMLDMWEKFVMITTMAGMNCLMRGTIGDIAATADGAELMLQLFAENQAVAEAAGYPTAPGLCRADRPNADREGQRQQRLDAPRPGAWLAHRGRLDHRRHAPPRRSNSGWRRRCCAPPMPISRSTRTAAPPRQEPRVRPRSSAPRPRRRRSLASSAAPRRCRRPRQAHP